MRKLSVLSLASILFVACTGPHHDLLITNILLLLLVLLGFEPMFYLIKNNLSNCYL